MCRYFLGGRDQFLVGSRASAADLLYCTTMDQTLTAGFDHGPLLADYR